MWNMLMAFRNLMTVRVAVLIRKFHNTSTKFAFLRMDY